MKTYKKLAIVIGGLIGGALAYPTVWAQTEPVATDEPKDPIVILRRAAEAAKAGAVIQYKTSVQPFGTTKPVPPRLEGTVLFSGWKDKDPEKFRYDITILPMEASGGSKITIGSDGTVFYVIDHDQKKVYSGLSFNVFGGFTNAYASFPITELVRAKPFEFEINSGGVSLVGGKKVGTEDCYEIDVKYGAKVTQDLALWFISKKDYLPRRLDKVNIRGDGKRLGRQVMLSDIVINPPLPADAFALKIPAGYQKLEQPAP